MHVLLDIGGVLFYLLLVGWFLTWALPVRLYLEAVGSGVRVGFGDLVGMRLRKTDPARVVRPMIVAAKTGLEVEIVELEAHELAGGSAQRVVQALVSADMEGIELPFEVAAAWDLAGRDPLEEVRKEVAYRKGVE